MGSCTCSKCGAEVEHECLTPEEALGRVRALEARVGALEALLEATIHLLGEVKFTSYERVGPWNEAVDAWRARRGD